MAKFIVPNGAQVKIYWVYGGYNFLNVLGASGTTAVTITQAIADTLGTAIKSAFVTSNLSTHYSPDMIMTKIGVRDVKSNTFPEFISSGPGQPGTGPALAETLPFSSSLIVTYKTALAGKSYRGRTYLPAMIEPANDQNANAIQAALDDAEAFIAAVRAALSTTGLAHAILSPALPADRYESDEPVPAKPAFATNVDSWNVRSTLWGSMRSRSHRL